jgi:phage gpG-like protein
MNHLNSNQKKRAGLLLQRPAFIGDLIMLFDIKKYMHHFERLDLSRAQKEELMRTVWGLMESSVDQVFEQHPVQHCRKPVSHKCLQSPTKRLDSKKPFITDNHTQTADIAEEGSEDYGR